MEKAEKIILWNFLYLFGTIYFYNNIFIKGRKEGRENEKEKEREKERMNEWVNEWKKEKGNEEE